MTLTKKYFFRELTPVFLFFLCLYITTVSRAISISYDSIQYIAYIIRMKGFFHPHHLFYLHLSYYWLSFLHFLGLKIDAHLIIESLNSIFGALTITLFYQILRKRIGLKPLIAFFSSCLPAFSWAFWYYSDCVEVYIIPLFFLLLIFYIITSNIRGKYYWVGLLQGLAIISHQVNLLLLLPILTYLIVIERKNAVKIFPEFLKYAIVTSVIVIAAYTAVFIWTGNTTLNKMWYFLTFYTHGTSWFQLWNSKTIPYMMIGFGRAIFADDFLFASRTANKLIERIFPDKQFMDEIYLVRNMTSLEANVLIILGFLIFTIIIFLIFSKLKYFRKTYYKYKNMSIFIIAWLIVYTLFFSFWDSLNHEFWIPQSFCIWLIFITVFKEGLKEKIYGLIITLLAIMLFIVNFFGSIFYCVSKENDFYLTNLKPIVKLAKPNDLVLVEQNVFTQRYLLYLTDSDVYQLAEYLFRNPVDSVFDDFYKDKIEKHIQSGSSIIWLKPFSAEKSIISKRDQTKINDLFDRMLKAGYRTEYLKNGIIIFSIKL